MKVNYATINKRTIDLMVSAKKHAASIDKNLKALVETRVSQINGCAYCVDLHLAEARDFGEGQQRLDCLSVWRESDLFSDSEMAALDWAESVTNISTTLNIEDKLGTLLMHFSEAEVVDLTFVIALMNGFNRIAISLGDKPAKR